MMKSIKKAVFPVAGLGTRFLPATKASPKEMLPIVDKPLIQYAVEEAIEAGIEQLIFITSSAKRAIEDYFDRSTELELILEKTNQLHHLSLIKKLLPKQMAITYVRQESPQGLGHAILCAKHLIHDEPFAVLLADDLMFHPQKQCLTQMVEYQHQHQLDGVIAIEAVAKEDTQKYGIVSLGKHRRIHHVVEKPSINQAPSNLAIVGRYILPSEIFKHLEKAECSVNQEIQLTDAIEKLLPTHPLHGYQFLGKRYDCGTKLGFMQANVDFALRHAEIGSDFESWIASVATTLTRPC